MRYVILFIFLFLMSCQKDGVVSFPTKDVYIVGDTVSHIIYGNEFLVSNTDSLTIKIKLGTEIKIFCKDEKKLKVYTTNPLKNYFNKSNRVGVFITNIN